MPDAFRGPSTNDFSGRLVALDRRLQTSLNGLVGPISIDAINASMVCLDCAQLGFGNVTTNVIAPPATVETSLLGCVIDLLRKVSTNNSRQNSSASIVEKR